MAEGQMARSIKLDLEIYMHYNGKKRYAKTNRLQYRCFAR